MTQESLLKFTGERIVPGADNCEPNFAHKMYQEHIARYIFAAQLCHGKTVIDVGCGIGYGSQLLAQSGAKSVYAFDLSQEAIEHAKKFYAHENVEFDVESAHNFIRPEGVDLIVCFELIEHIDHQERAIRRMAKFLKPDGVLVISTPRALESKRTHFHTHEFELGEFEDLLEQKFEAVDIWFENNHFSTIVARKAPQRFERVENLNNDFTLKTADYFIAVARKSAATILPPLNDVFLVSDESYVKLLERDVAILHEAEDNLKIRHDELAMRFGELEVRCAQYEVDLRKAGESLACQAATLNESLVDLTSERDRLEAEFRASEGALAELACELEVVRQSLVQLEATLFERNVTIGDLRERHIRLEVELSEREGAIDCLRRELELVHVEKDELRLAVRSSEGALANALQNITVLTPQLEGALAAQKQLHCEFDQVKADLEDKISLLESREESWRRHASELVQVIEDHRSSTSWKMTAPVRALKIGPKMLFSRGPKFVQYVRENGPRAAMNLVSRKIGLTPAVDEFAARLVLPATPKSDPRIQTVENLSPKPSLFDVVFFIGCWEGESKRYRVLNVAEALEAQGYRVKVHPESTCFDLVDQDWRARAVVFFRTPYRQNFRIHDVIAHTHAHGGKVVFDIDDLVFEPDLIDQIHGVKALNPTQKVEYREGVEAYRKLLLSCDVVTVSTPPLVRAVEALGKSAYIIPNSLNLAQINAAEAIRATKASRKGGPIRVGYFSGSRTHERDFAEAEEPLFELLKARPDVEFLLVGHLELGERWNAVSSQVIRHSFVPPLEMLELLGQCDINIAPLEVGDLFCEAKSELKFFEAALVDTPTIASPTEPFRLSMVDGETGFLAASAADWRAALHRLVDDAELRKSMGERARAAALENFGPAAIARAAKAWLLGEVEQALTPDRFNVKDWSAARRLRIDWIIPRLIIGGGGHRNILRAAHQLQCYGHDVALHFTSSDDQAKILHSLVRDHFYPFMGEVKAYDGVFRESDVIFATHWTTVDAALRARGRTKEIMYFVQDFEPAFAPMGSEYVLAENTYRQGLYCITSGPWCERLLKNDYGCEADHFRFPVDRKIYFERPRTKPNRNIIFFAKPDMPRRCYEIGSMALAHLHRMRPDVEIILFGSGAIKRENLDFPATLLEIVPTIEDLSILYANADLGIVFSTTNPSLVPYEMMASGCPVVDLDRPGNECNYAERRDIAFLADPIPERMAAQVAELLDRPEELAQRRAAGLEFAATFPNEVQMARRVEHLIFSRMKARNLL